MNFRYLTGFGVAALFANSLHATDYCFVDKKHHWHFESDFAAMGNASFRSDPVKHTHLQYAEGSASLYYNHFVTENNALVAQAGLSYTRLHWDENPRFKQDNYYYAIASLSWVSYAIEQWRWVINAGLSFDATNFDVSKSGVYYGLLWGRYQYTPTFAMHMGVFGYVSSTARNGFLLPVLGIDWHWSDQWEFKGIFPLETSLNYHFHQYWATALMFTTFGGPYRFPRRAHEGVEGYENAIFEVYSTGLEWDLKFKTAECFKAGVGVGYNFGGWILIKNQDNHHGKYYKFDSSPYARVYLGFTF